jgi:ATP-dependent DNA helicase RecG
VEKLSKSPRINKFLYQMGIFNYYDVVNHLPRRYEDFSYTHERDLKDKERVVLLGKVVSIPKYTKAKRVNVTTFDFMTVNKSYFRVVAFNRQYLAGNINLTDVFTLVGVYNRKRGEIDFINMYKGEIPLSERIKPVYSLPQGYENHLFSSLVRKSLVELDGHIASLVPYTYLTKYKLVKKSLALKWAHFPENYEQVKQSLRHLKYEEALMFSLKNQIIKQENKSLAKIRKEPIDLSLCEPWLKTLPYSLTEDQKTAAEEIIEDMNQSGLMYRLLQGDVGTGKTLVCFIALYANYIRGDQGALMAPTDALARQHFENAKKIFKDTKLHIALLLGSTPMSEKKRIYADLEDGTIDIVIGTHALFAKSVVYSSLGLAIIDEQHRFGVNQRLTLANKGEHADLLMMSATPIPRTLALSLYGDLDISTLTSFPSKKRDVLTKIVSSDDEEIFASVEESLKDNHQVYVVAPLIEYREDERYSVEKLYARFALKFKGKVGLLHGKMSNGEKEEALNKFYSGELPILVSTPVIEVGIDVKGANLMIIYDASNFGLASLHQLRGRIGRDGKPSKCLLTLDDEEDKEAKDRLSILARSEDGFVIAEEDMKLRGPGELAGLKQSGIPTFSFLNVVNDYKIFVVARDDAKEIMKNKNNEEYRYILSRAEKEVNINPILKG